MDVDTQLFKNVIKEARNNADLLDSYSPNQFKSKEKLIAHINNLDILDKNSKILIMGSWYASIFVPAFHKQVQSILAVDMDDIVIRIAKNRLFSHIDNADFWTKDVFDLDSSTYEQSDLIINTSCEHMKPMKDLEQFKQCKGHFAFQSNNMFDIPTHTNCVNNIEEFKQQLPNNTEVLIEDKVQDERGTRFMLIGRFI